MLLFRKKQKKMLPFREQQRKIAYFFILPALISLCIFFYLPVIATFYLSFTRYNILQSPQWIGIKGYTRLLANSLFWKSLQNTAVYSLGYIPGKMVLGLLLALILNQKIKGVVAFRTLFYTPMVTSVVAASLVWMWMYNVDTGIINYALTKLRLPPQKWLFSIKLALPSVTVISIWKDLGGSMIIFLAGLQRIPDQIYEAARIDGASRWNLFWNMTLPLLKPTTLLVLVWSLIDSSQIFTTIYIMTSGGPANSTTTIAHQIYVNAFQYLKMGVGSSMAVILFFLIFTLSFLNLKFFKGAEYY